MNPAEYEAMFRLEELHWYFRGKRRIVRQLLEPYVGSLPLTILDAGCGTGGMLPLLDELGELYAIDPFPDAVNYCFNRGFTRISQASVTALPFPDESFDLVTSFDVIEHVDDDCGAMRELYRVLRPGGVLMLTVPACMFLWSGHDEALHHKRRYGGTELRSKLASSGFGVERCTSFNTMLFPVVAAVRMVRRKLGLESGSSDSSELPSSVVNTILTAVLDAEARLLAHLDLPVGVSLACVGRKVTGV